MKLARAAGRRATFTRVSPGGEHWPSFGSQRGIMRSILLLVPLMSVLAFSACDGVDRAVVDATALGGDGGRARADTGSAGGDGRDGAPPKHDAAPPDAATVEVLVDW